MSPIGCRYLNRRRRMNVKSLEITNELLMKAIECCLIVDCDTCDYCPLYDRDNGCTEDGTYTLLERAFDLIKRQQMEIENLKKSYEIYEETSGLKWAKAEAIKEFAERLKKKRWLTNYAAWVVSVDDIHKLVKEMTEVSNENRSY